MDNDVESVKKKLSQNIQALIGEIGEKQVLLRLAILAHQTSWQVFYNLGEAGYDILLLNSESGKKIRIEVKTRQRFYTTGKTRIKTNYFLTNGEYIACDFLIAYLVNNNGFYIVPKGDLKETVVNGKSRWRFTSPTIEQGDQYSKEYKYLNAWNLMDSDFNPNKL